MQAAGFRERNPDGGRSRLGTGLRHPQTRLAQTTPPSPALTSACSARAVSRVRTKMMVWPSFSHCSVKRGERGAGQEVPAC